MSTLATLFHCKRYVYNFNLPCTKALLGLSLSCWHHKPMLDDVMILERYIEMWISIIAGFF